MEVIAATFAHRGCRWRVRWATTARWTPRDGHGHRELLRDAAKKEILRRALGRLSRVRSLVEYPMRSPLLRKTAVFRVGGRIAPRGGSPARLEEIAYHAAADETTYLLVASRRR